MPAKCSLFIDAGYLLASAASRLTGTSLRSGVHVKYATLIRGLIQQAEDATGLKVLRVYWYDSAKDGVPDRTQERIGELPKVKLRLGRFGYDGQQKGVDLRLGLDMVTHARNNAAEVFLLVSGDDDLTEAVEDVQIHGVSVAVLAVPGATGQPHGVSRHLVRAADEIITIAPGIIDDAVIPIETPEPIEDEHAEPEMGKVTDAGFVLSLPGGNSAIVPIGDHGELADLRPLASAGLGSEVLGSDELGSDGLEGEHAADATGQGEQPSEALTSTDGEPHLILPPPDIHTLIRHMAPQKQSGVVGESGPAGETSGGAESTLIDVSADGTSSESATTQPLDTDHVASPSDATVSDASLGLASDLTLGAVAGGSGSTDLVGQDDQSQSSTQVPTVESAAELTAEHSSPTEPDAAASPSAPASPTSTVETSAPAAAPAGTSSASDIESETNADANYEPPPITRPSPSVVAAALSRMLTPPTPRSLSSSQARATAHLRPTYSIGPDTKPSGTWARQWESTMEQVVGRVLSSLGKSSTAENWEIIKLGRPSIPQDIDKALLLDATEAMGVYTLSDAERHEVRSTFWREFDKLHK